MNIVETRIYRRDDGYYEFLFSLKESFKGFFNNRDDVVRRMYYFKKRFTLSSNEEYKEEYMKFMGDMIENGYIEKVLSDVDAEFGMIFYINYYSIRYSKKKLRIVFNCS